MVRISCEVKPRRSRAATAFSYLAAGVTGLAAAGDPTGLAAAGDPTGLAAAGGVADRDGDGARAGADVEPRRRLAAGDGPPAGRNFPSAVPEMSEASRCDASGTSPIISCFCSILRTDARPRLRTSAVAHSFDCACGI